VLSALRHRAAELGDQAEFSQVHTYAEALDRPREPLSVCAPMTWSSRDYVLRRPGLAVLAARGFVATQEVFAGWAEGRGRRRLLMEDFYRENPRRHDVLWAAPSRSAGAGTSTTTTGSRRPPTGGSPSPSRGGPGRTRSTSGCAPTWTAGRPTVTSPSWGTTARGCSR
jgi:deoxyribodipyrimidine photolyase-like uncharacterized protein